MNAKKRQECAAIEMTFAPISAAVSVAYQSLVRMDT